MQKTNQRLLTRPVSIRRSDPSGPDDVVFIDQGTGAQGRGNSVLLIVTIVIDDLLHFSNDSGRPIANQQSVLARGNGSYLPKPVILAVGQAAVADDPFSQGA